MSHGGEDTGGRAAAGRWLIAGLVSIGVAGPLVIGACTDGGGDSRAGPGGGRAAKIPQPVVSGLSVAPASDRVDIAMPTFSNPTHVTNPLFPVSRQESVLFLGHVENKPFRTEVTLLPFTRIVEWEGQRVETLVSQYLAYLDGRIQEVAYDLYAQADDGSVWYFGEDVSDFEDGVIITKEGTWLAGKDAPAAMIMPGHPMVGDVYRTENSPGFAFEEVTVKSVDKTLDGPVAAIDGGLIAEELHMDGNTEDKIFAPGYGEFYTADGKDVEALALAVPTDAQPGPVPAELLTMETGAATVFQAAQSGDWRAASAEVHRMTGAWESYRTGDVPKLIAPRMTEALAALAEAVDARNAVMSRWTAIDVGQSSLDLQLPYRPPVEISFARLDLWAARVIVDAGRRDDAAVNGDVFTLGYLRDRILRSLVDADMTRVNTQLLELQVAATDADFAAATHAAAQLRDIVTEVKPAR
jgi:hypothetical protein